MNDVLTEVRFWAQVMGDARRTVLCEPDMESRIKGWVDARGLGGIIKVIVSPFCPQGQIIIMDEQAIMADINRPVRLRMRP